MKTIQSKILLIVSFILFTSASFGYDFPPPVYFDWEKTNAERFVNSPCYQELGFNPSMDPVAQEKRYQECEEARRNQKIGNFASSAIKVVLVIFCIFLFFFGLASRSPRARRDYY